MGSGLELYGPSGLKELLAVFAPIAPLPLIPPLNVVLALLLPLLNVTARRTSEPSIDPPRRTARPVTTATRTPGTVSRKAIASRVARMA